MKNKLILGIIGFLLASSTMFAGWGAGFGAAYYGVPAVVYAGPVHAHYHGAWVRPSVARIWLPCRRSSVRGTRAICRHVRWSAAILRCHLDTGTLGVRPTWPILGKRLLGPSTLEEVAARGF
jgi:hypothetical protein